MSNEFNNVNEETEIEIEELAGEASVISDSEEQEVFEEPVAKIKLPEPKVEKTDKVAVHSSRNVTWSGVGKVYNGYNIVTEDQAEKWLTRDHIRLATPQEVAKEFGL
jgi:kynurenine formamidase